MEICLIEMYLMLSILAIYFFIILAYLIMMFLTGIYPNVINIRGMFKYLSWFNEEL